MNVSNDNDLWKCVGKFGLTALLKDFLTICIAIQEMSSKARFVVWATMYRGIAEFFLNGFIVISKVENYCYVNQFKKFVSNDGVR